MTPTLCPIAPRLVPGRREGVTLYECAVPGCDAFPWPTETDALLCPHTGAAKTDPQHPAQGTIIEARGPWNTVANGFGGTTTVRVETPEIVRPTEKQTNFLRSLLAERAGDEQAEVIRVVLNQAREAGTLDRKTVSKAIDALLKIARPTVTPTQRPATAPSTGLAAFLAVPAGKYAVGEVLVSWDAPTEGKWAGYVFVKSLTMVGNPEADEKVSFVEGRRVAILNPSAPTPRIDDSHAAVIAAIVADVAGCAVAFGRKTIHCSFCGRHLETKASKFVGYGPVCADKHGLPWGEEG